MKKYIFTFGILFVGMVSCSSPDYYNTLEGEAYREYYVEKIKADYTAAFISAFGEIAPNQSWDFSIAGKKRSSVRTAKNETVQDADYVFIVEGDKSELKESVELPASPISACSKFFEKKDGKDNSKEGDKEYTIISQGEVIIAPAWHGECTIDYTFVVEGIHPQTGIITKYTFSPKEIGALLNYGNWIQTEAIQNGDGKPKGWIFPFSKGTLVHFYLMNGDRQGTTIKAKKNSNLYGNNVLHPNQDPHYTDVFLLDDANNDKDYNDLVVFTATNEGVAPPPIVTEDKTQIIPGPSKRYMVEDLGASQSSDIDFNDIVADFYQVTKRTETYKNGQLTNTKEESIQTAIIRALGGTKNIRLFVGNECIYTKSGHTDYSIYDMLNTSGNINYNSETNAIETIDLSTKGGNPWLPWIADSNNIKIVVDDNNYNVDETSSDNVQRPDRAVSWSIAWADPGTVPSIIAVDPIEKWNYERISVFDNSAELNLLKLTQK